MASNSIMHALKRAVSPSRTVAAELHPPAITPHTLPESTPFTRYVLDNLELEANEHRMLVITFAPQIQMDCDAKVLDFDDYFHLLGHKTKGNALRTLGSTIEGSELIVIKNDKNSVGRPRDVYLLSVNQFEEVLLAANTDSGKKWRKLVLKIKNLVVNYMKMEMEAGATRAQKELEDRMSQLAIKDEKLEELESAQAELQATLEAERERRSAMKALRDAEDDPKHTAYLMQSGVHRSYIKIGKTGEEGGEKRKKELQTGNPEEISVLFEIKCVDSKLVERNLHHIFRWYKRRGEWYEIDKERAIYVTRMIVNLLDGLRRVEHDTTDIVEACQRVLTEQHLEAPLTRTSSDADEWAEFRKVFLLKRDGRCKWVELFERFKTWFLANGGSIQETNRKSFSQDVKKYFEKHLGERCKLNRIDSGPPILSFRGWTLLDSDI